MFRRAMLIAARQHLSLTNAT